MMTRQFKPRERTMGSETAIEWTSSTRCATLLSWEATSEPSPPPPSRRVSPLRNTSAVAPLASSGASSATTGFLWTSSRSIARAAMGVAHVAADATTSPLSSRARTSTRRRADLDRLRGRRGPGTSGRPVSESTSKSGTGAALTRTRFPVPTAGINTGSANDDTSTIITKDTRPNITTM